MKTDIKWINNNKVRKTLSNINFSEDLVYPAHTQEHPGYIPYVPKSQFDIAIKEIVELKKQLAATKQNLGNTRGD